MSSVSFTASSQARAAGSLQCQTGLLIPMSVHATAQAPISPPIERSLADSKILAVSAELAVSCSKHVAEMRRPRQRHTGRAERGGEAGEEAVGLAPARGRAPTLPQDGREAPGQCPTGEQGTPIIDQC